MSPKTYDTIQWMENMEFVQQFTIDSIEQDGNSVLQLKWGENIFEVK